MIVARAGLSLAVGLHQKTAKVGYQLVYLLHLAFPPFGYCRVQRVGSLGIAQCHRCGKVNAEVGLDAIGPQDVGNLFHLFQIGGCQHLRRGIDIVEH